MTHRTVSEDMRGGIRAAVECHDICTEAITYCADHGARHVEPAHLKALVDCAEICDTAVWLMLRNVDLHPRLCEVYAETCDRCARSCDQLGGDEFMRQCADICRQCAEAWRQLAGIAA